MGEKRKWLDRAQTDVIDPSADLFRILVATMLFVLIGTDKCRAARCAAS